MYRLWIERSVRGELADAVLVAGANPTDRAELIEHEPAGMVTLEESEGVGQIGLIAVADAMRRARHRLGPDRGRPSLDASTRRRRGASRHSVGEPAGVPSL